MPTLCSRLILVLLTCALGSCVTHRQENEGPSSHRCGDSAEFLADAKLEHRATPLRVVFFSSWCQSCEEKMLLSYPEETMLVGTFDDRDAIERVYAASGSKYPCYADKGDHLAKKLGVKSLPYSRTWPAAKHLSQQEGP